MHLVHYQAPNVGFIQMYRSILQKAKAFERVLQWKDGERRITNFNHLAELIHEPDLVAHFVAESLLAITIRRTREG